MQMSLVGLKFVGSALVFILAFLVSILIIADRPDWRRLVAMLQIRKGQFNLGELRLRDRPAPAVWDAVPAAQ
jgi:hypothetical protein